MWSSNSRCVDCLAKQAAGVHLYKVVGLIHIVGSILLPASNASFEDDCCVVGFLLNVERCSQLKCASS